VEFINLPLHIDVRGIRLFMVVDHMEDKVGG
jgi:hypothetical protein